MLLKNKLLEKKRFLIFNIVTIFIYIYLYTLIPVYKKHIEDHLLQNSLKFIDYTSSNIIEKLKKDSDHIVYDFVKNKNYRKQAIKLLSIIKNDNVKYIYLVFKSKNGKYRYLVDLSNKDRAELLEVFNPIKPEIWDEVYKTHKEKIIYQNSINSLGFTYLKPIINNSEVVAILAMDYTKKELNSINDLTSYLQHILIFLLSLNFILINFSVFEIYKSIKNEKQLYSDDLTKLYNLAYFKEISGNINISDYDILLIDIDLLERINNTFGWKKGDEIIVSIADTLSKFISSKDILIRYAGGTFMMLKYHLNDDISNFSDNIREYIYENITIDNKNNVVTISIGINNTTKEDLNLDDSIKKAHLALYEAKKRGGNNSYFCNHNLISNDLLSLETIKNALENDKLITLYQPIIDLKTNKLSHYESLVRLVIDSEIIAPYKFLPVIENTYLYTELTKEVIQCNLNMFKKYDDVKVSINFTAEDLLNNSIINTLKDNKNFSNRILIEILETQEIADYDRLNVVIKDLKDMGYKICIDDFGSGYSNLMHILNMDIDYLKIDASVIKNIHKDEKSFLITENMINFSKKTNIKIVAEYVENEEILEVLKKLDADYGQGYLFSKPEKIEYFYQS
jgi:diguanylate cyclase (GGDEF)-like protein